jgi:hypothetical protein
MELILMNQVLFEQLLEGNIEYKDVPEDTDIELTDEQRHEMRLWLVGVYGFSYGAAKSYID